MNGSWFGKAAWALVTLPTPSASAKAAPAMRRIERLGLQFIRSCLLDSPRVTRTAHIRKVEADCAWPRRDAARCNRHAPRPGGQVLQTFQILGRSGRAAH